MSQHELNELFAKKGSGVISDAEMKMLQRILESKEKKGGIQSVSKIHWLKKFKNEI